MPIRSCGHLLQSEFPAEFAHRLLRKIRTAQPQSRLWSRLSDATRILVPTQPPEFRWKSSCTLQEWSNANLANKAAGLQNTSLEIARVSEAQKSGCGLPASLVLHDAG